MDLSTTCSRMWDQLDVPAWGTAAVAAFWLLIEQPGPWGAKALTESDLDPTLGAELGRRVKAAGGEVLLIRRPGRHAEAASRRVYLAGDGVLLRADVADVAALLDADLAHWRAWAAGAGFEAAEPIVAVCTNGKRDQCCSLRGRAVASDADDRRPGQVWESSHLHGHRFAPTALALPAGLVLAGVDADAVVAQLDASDRGELAAVVLDPRRYRGRSGLDKAAQVAEAAVRIRLGDLDPTSLQVSPDGDAYLVAHRDGRRFRIRATQRDVGERVVSCGKQPTPQAVWYAEFCD